MYCWMRHIDMIAHMHTVLLCCDRLANRHRTCTFCSLVTRHDSKLWNCFFRHIAVSVFVAFYSIQFSECSSPNFSCDSTTDGRVHAGMLRHQPNTVVILPEIAFPGPDSLFKGNFSYKRHNARDTRNTNACIQRRWVFDDVFCVSQCCTAGHGRRYGGRRQRKGCEKKRHTVPGGAAECTQQPNAL